MNKYFSKTNNTENILSWKSKGISDDLIKALYNNRVTKLLYPYLSAMHVSFNGSCLVKESKSVSKDKVLNTYIVYHLGNTSHSFHPRLKNCLFRSVNITKKY